jgi:hypothetical protein
MPQSCTPRLVCQALRVVVALSLLGLVACGDSRGYPKVYPVKGKILVNGQPANDCQIYLNRTAGGDPQAPQVKPQAATNENGEFQLTSYNANDGAPEGEYVVTIEWRDRVGLMKAAEGVDQLDGVYATVDKTKGLPGFLIKVERKPLELPPFDLKQSPEAKRKAEEARKRRPGFDGKGPL